MDLTLKRIFKGDTYTIGKLYIDGQYFCDTLEDKVRDLTKEAKVYGQTAIPEGIYDVTLSQSPKFGRLLPELHNVPQFTGIRIHSGNTAADSLGCILVGENKAKGMVLSSRVWESNLVEKLTGQSGITIKIE